MKRLFNSPESIVAAIKDGDQAVLKHLYGTYFTSIKSMVVTNGGDQEDVQDILQEGIIVFYEKAMSSDFVLTCDAGTFLYAICKNKWLKELRRKSGTTEFTDVHENSLNGMEQDTIDEEVFSEKQTLLKDLLNEIGENCKNLLSYFYYNKLPMTEIAVKMGYTNASNAKNQKYKCLKRLQKMAENKFNREE